MVRWFLLPFLAHFALVMSLYVALTIVRMRSVSAGEVKVSDFARADGDARRSRAIQRNLANQFELPLFAYVAALLLILWQAVGVFDIIAAWIFLIGRVVHTAVQTLTDNVPLRGQVFMINTVGVVGLMGHVAWRVVTGGLP
jgi:hypothetical protein